MPGRLLDLQVRQVEVGRIRMGSSTVKTSKAGREYSEPVKLERFRLTCRSRALIEAAAQAYGGQVEEWTPQGGGVPQYALLVEADGLRVIVPPEPVSQYYELWAGKACQRRCDGQMELLSGNPCVCGPDSKACKPTTRLSLMLADLPGVGIWRLETHGYYAATELPAIADLLSRAGGNVPARLEMEERTQMAPDPRQPDKKIQVRFMVPVLHVEATPAQIVGSFGRPPAAIEAGQPQAVPALPAGEEPPALPAGPAPERTVAEEDALVKLANQLHAALGRCETREQVEALVGKIKAMPGLSEQTAAGLLKMCRARWTEMASDPGAAPAAPAPVQAAAPEPVGPVWMQVQAWAGGQTPPLKLAELNARFVAWSGGVKPGESNGAQMRQFLAEISR